jgi:hypothetical protein
VLLDDIGHRHRLARPGDAEEGLEPIAALDATRQFGDSLRLIASWLKGSLKVESGAKHPEIYQPRRFLFGLTERSYASLPS